MFTASQSTHQFPRNRVMTTLMVVNTLLFALCGLINITTGQTAMSMVWFFGAVLFYINFLWSKRTPFIQLTETGMTLIHAMARPKQQVSFHTITSVERVSDFKAYLHLNDGKRIKLALYFLNKEDRIPLLHRLDTLIDDKTSGQIINNG